MAANYILLGVSENSINVFSKEETSISSLFDTLTTTEEEDPFNFRFTRNGLPVEDVCSKLQLQQEEEESGVVIIRACPRLLGGKGGFGALIRAMGMRINKGRGKDACRDLSGRRMRDVNAEKQLAEWNTKEPDRKRKRDEEKLKKRKEMLEGPKHYFNDPQYMQQLEETESNMDDAVRLGLLATSSKNVEEKSKDNGKLTNGNRKNGKSLWLGFDDEEESSDSEDEDGQDVKRHKSCDDNDEDISIPTVPPINTEEEDTERDSESMISLTNVIANNEETEQLPVKENPPPVNNKPSPPAVTNIDPAAFDLEAYNSVEELESVGGETLKAVLQSKGLKCGGTVQERAVRLFSIKGKRIDEIDQSLFTKGTVGKQKGGKGKNKQSR